MLGGKHTKVAVSTLREARGLLPLVHDGTVTEVSPDIQPLSLFACLFAYHSPRTYLWTQKPQILYAMPLRPGALAELSELSKTVKIIVLIDHEQHIDILERFFQLQSPSKRRVWDAFIKIDVGARRAGIRPDSPRLAGFVERARRSPAVSVYGLYAYGGQSYDDAVALGGAEGVLREEVQSLLTVASRMARTSPLVLSFGTTPTAHVVSTLGFSSSDDWISFEIHPGESGPPAGHPIPSLHPTRARVSDGHSR